MTNTPAEDLAIILDHLDNWLHAQRDDGVTRLSAKVPTPKTLDELKKQAAYSKQDEKLSPKVRPRANEVSLVQLTLVRMEGCPDGEGVKIGLLIEEQELQGDSHPLLLNMLKAIGFEPEGSHSPFSGKETKFANFPLLLAMGEPALSPLSPVPHGFSMFRGKVIDTAVGSCVPTFAPSYLETTPTAKKTAWKDLQLVLTTLSISMPDWVKKK